MSITRHHSGRWLYQFDKRIEGQRQRANRLLPEGWTRQQAQAYDRTETARLYALASGIGKVAEPLISASVLLYVREHLPTLRDSRNIGARLVALQPWYKGKTLAKLSDIARSYASDQLGNLAPATIRNDLSYLRAAVRWAWKHRGIGEHDPGARMTMPKVDNARQTYITRAQMLAAARTLAPGSDSRRAMKLAFYTGKRPKELLLSQIVTVSGLTALSSATTKNAAPHIVPVHRKALHALRPSWPLTWTRWTISKHVGRALKLIGVEDGVLYTLRHSAASEMINNEVDLYQVGQVLGHKSSASTKRYAHLSVTTMADAVSKIGAKRVNNSQPKPMAKAA